MEPYRGRPLGVGLGKREVTPLGEDVAGVALAGEVEQVEGVIVELDHRAGLAGADRDVVDRPHRSSSLRVAA